MHNPSDRVEIEVSVNGKKFEREVETRQLLVDFLREDLNLTGTHIGCESTYCGACTVLMDGRSVKSCTVFALSAHQTEIRTVEGLVQDNKLHPLQEGFSSCHGLQCGYCTPGFLMSALALLEKNPNPSEEEIRKGVAGNICRCTGYQNIIKAIGAAAQQMSTRE